MQTLDQLFVELRNRDVRVWEEAGTLRCSAPKGALTPVLQAELSRRKDEILALLRQASQRPGESVALARVPRQGSIPVSFGQQRLWFLHQLDPDSPGYNITAAFRFTVEPNVRILTRVLREIIRRHEVLRTTFAFVDGEPVQIIAADTSVELPVIDLRGLDDTERTHRLEGLCIAESRRTFDLERGPLWNFVLVHVRDGEHDLVVTQHHIVTDRWSLGVLGQEVATLYDAFAANAPSPLPDLPFQYADFAVWQRRRLQGTLLEGQLAFWKDRLGTNLPVLDLPTDRPRPAVPSDRGASRRLTIPRSVAGELEALSQREAVTPFMTLLAAFTVLLHRYSGQEDLVVGCPISTRGQQALEPLMGFFVNSLALRTDVSGNPTFRELVKRVRQVTTDAYDHQDVPFEKIVETLRPSRDVSTAPVFQVQFVFQNIPRAFELASNVAMWPGTGAVFDLTLYLVNTDLGLEATLEYSTDLFDAPTIDRMLGHFRELLSNVAANPDRRLAEFRLMTSSDEHQLLIDWNATDTTNSPDTCLHGLFEEQAARTPDAVAVVAADGQLTYRELDERSSRLAQTLAKLGVERGTLVGVSLDRSLDMVVALLGILKAGGAYVPLDPAFPRDRLAFMVADSRARLIVTQSDLVDAVTNGVPTLCLDTASAELSAESAEPLDMRTTSDDLAYVLYTSGSTGRPKGVQISHSAVVNFLRSMRHEPGLSSTDVMLAVTTLSFDIAALEIYLPLSCGSRVVIASRDEVADGTRLAARLEACGATVMQATPATWRLLIEAEWAGRPHLKVLCGGEALSRELADQLLARAGSVWNLYGPTETTIWSTVEQIHSSDRPVSIGRPIANTCVYVLDAHWQPVPVGVRGELYIGGDGVGQGYLGRPDLTAERFLPDPFDPRPGARIYRTGDVARWWPDGRLECLGRVDHQVKVRGFRIELGEIEAALSNHPSVKQAVVSVHEAAPGDRRLVAYVVCETGQYFTISEIRRFARHALPGYMVPSFFVELEQVPLTPNGKVDRKALPNPFGRGPQASADRVLPRTPEERAIAEIWGELLGIDGVGVRDNFYDIGGHSLLSIRAARRIEAKLGLRLSPRVLITDTLEQIAAHCERLATLPPSLLTASAAKGSK